MVSGRNYSISDYQNYDDLGDSNYFEEVIDKMIIDGIEGMNESFRDAIMSLDRDKKRMTILSLLDKDHNLFKRIKALTDKNINKMEHIKDIILMLRDYVKVGEVEKKKFGEVMTPLELVKEMLNTLPEEVWSNPNLKWLDPANGTGPYPVMVIYKLMKGLEDWEPDEEKRYKHIVENMIYVSELQPKNMFLYMFAVDPFDKYELNIYTGSFLEEGFDKHMKEVWDIDKFDIVMGNPPYNDDVTSTGDNKLYLLFISKVLNNILKDNGYLNFITPKKAIENFIDLTKNRNYMKNHKDVVYLAIDTPSRFFKVGSSFCFFTIKNKKFDGGFTYIEYYDTKGQIKYTKENIFLFKKLPKYLDEVTISILKKTVFNESEKFNFRTMKKFNNTNFRIRRKQILDGVVKLESDEVFRYKILDKLKVKGETYYFISDKMKDHDIKKVIISKGGSYTCPIYHKGGLSCSDNLLYLPVNNDMEGNNMVYFINSKLLKFLENCMTKGSDMDYSWCIKNISKCNLDCEMTDIKIYEYYNLNQEEIDLIENTIK